LSGTVEFHKYQMMKTPRIHNSAELIHAIKQSLVAIRRSRDARAAPERLVILQKRTS
jgi:hypothetical protein